MCLPRRSSDPGIGPCLKDQLSCRAISTSQNAAKPATTMSFLQLYAFVVIRVKHSRSEVLESCSLNRVHFTENNGKVREECRAMHVAVAELLSPDPLRFMGLMSLSHQLLVLVGCCCYAACE